MRATKAIIHLEYLAHNIQTLRRHWETVSKGKTPRLCVPVKADAYGHGAVAVAQKSISAGAHVLAVAAAEEGAILRNAGITAPVLLLSPVLADELDAAASFRLTPFVSEREAISAAARAAQKQRCVMPVYLKIETGMGRGGCAPSEAASLARYIVSQDALTLAGVATHFAVSESADHADKQWTEQQLTLFMYAIGTIQSAGIDPGIITAANSGAAISWPSSWFDMARPGIILYGYQSTEIQPALPFKPVMELVTRVVLVKKFAEGDTVSYGRTWRAPCNTHIGVLPIGYGDGLPRLLSCRQGNDAGFYVVIHGKRYPVVGRICMDQCMIDIGAEPDVRRGDAVTVFGGGPPSLNAGDIAEQTGTIPYEIFTNINKRVPRIYTP